MRDRTPAVRQRRTAREPVEMKSCVIYQLVTLSCAFSIAAAQPRQAGYIAPGLQGIWLLNNSEMPLQAGQPVFEGNVITFSARSRDGALNQLVPAMIVVRDLNGQLIDSRECKESGCSPPPIVLGTTPPPRLPDAFGTIYAAVMHRLFTKPSHPVNGIVRAPASCTDGTAVASQGIVDMSDVIHGPIKTASLSSATSSAGESGPRELTLTNGTWHGDLVPGLYTMLCPGEVSTSPISVLVLSPERASQVVKEITDVRERAKKFQGEEGVIFFRTYLELLSEGGQSK